MPIFAAKIDLGNMRVTQHSHSQGSAELFRASMFSILNSILLLRGLINLFIFLTRRNRNESLHSILQSRSYCTAMWTMTSTCKYCCSRLCPELLKLCVNIADCTLFTIVFDHCGNSGYLTDKKKPIIFSMARFDIVKNLTGLVEWYGKNARLRNLVNLVIVGGFFDPSKSKDREEMAEIRKMHGLIEKYQLKGQIRWIAAQTDRYRNGELYRCIADTRGAFVQPALYEAFGLTVIEAMNCGLPTFATNQGGPAEIIVDGVSGFHIDPNRGEESSNKIADFFEKCKVDNECWNKISAEGLKRINEW